MTDTELLNALENMHGVGLISDDNGHWAVSGVGFQNVPMGGEPEDIQSTFFVEGDEWFDSVRDAIKDAMEYDGHE